ncbi:MAG: hypothetical protein WCT41_00200 [Candidatus Paceibacterota bacterium]|jgi:hypothetical protein
MSEVKLLLPKFLTKEIVLTAMRSVGSIAVGAFPLKRNTFHTVLIAPAMEYEADRYPNHPIQPVVIAELSHGNKSEWSHDYANIAQCKTLQLWHGRNDGGTDAKPHLLMEGDTPFWGGVWRDGLASGCSGVQSHFDRMIAGMVVDAAVALAYDACIAWCVQNPDADFV